ncbi:MAG TPA: DUF2298 domain-containing protein [Chloroflexia bacterium]|nr:DUF2298 domain-containing protein [Chloroflexia bacterium]
MGEAFIWWLTLEILGIVAFPICALVLRTLPDRGYAVTKVLGLLLVGWLAYTIAMAHLVPFGRLLLVLSLLIVAGFSSWLLMRKGRALLREVQALLRDRSFVTYVIVAEVLFTVAFVAWALLRAYAPDIYGTEKFMDFGFMNSIAKSESFPPNDMWLSGYPINYYYFGYFLMASLSLLSGVPTQIGYNLAIATLFSLTAVGAFGVAYNLTTATIRRRAASASRSEARGGRANGAERHSKAQAHAPIPAKTKAAIPAETPSSSVPTRRVHKTSITASEAVMEAASVAVVDQPATRRGYKAAGGEDSAGDSAPHDERSSGIHRERSMAYDSPAVVVDHERRGPRFLSPYFFGVLAALMVVGMGHLTTAFAVKTGDVMEGNGWRYCFLCQTPATFSWWDPSRVIRDYKYLPAQPGQPPQKTYERTDPINEFPAFSFILADMHPHVMALPLWMLAGYFIIALARRRVLRGSAWADGWPRGLRAWVMLSLVALIIGTLYVTNTWDYPTFLLLALGTLALPYLTFQRRSDQPRGWRWLRPWLVQTVFITVLSLALFLPFHLTFKSLVGSQPAEIPANLANIPILGWVLQKLGSLLIVNTYDKGIVGFLVIFGIFLVAILGWLAYETGRYFRQRAIEQPVATEGAVLGGLFVVTLLAAALLRFPLLALLLPMAVLALYLTWREPELVERNVVLLMVALMSLIALAIEVVYLRDIFNARQNTIFKFYYQVWVLWAIAAAYGVWRVLSAVFKRSEVVTSRRAGLTNEEAPPATKAVAAAWAGVFGVLVLSGLIYLVYGYMNRIGTTPTLRGLDGTAHLAFSAPGDLPAINWLKQNATGADVVLECCRDEYNVPGHAGRVSSYTGIPTLIAWGGHEAQWRGGQPQLLQEAGTRRGVVTSIYTAQAPANTPDGLLRTLQQYSVDYVFVGAVERGEGGAAGGDPGERVTPAAEALFQQTLTEVYRSGTTAIYGVAKGEPGTSIAPLPTATPEPQIDLNVPPLTMFTTGQAGINRGQFNLPRGIARDASGNFYVVDTGNLRIQKFDSTGKWLAIFGGGRGDRDGQFGMLRDGAIGTGPGGIAVDAGGNIYVADTWNHRIQKFDSSGRFITKWGAFTDLGDANTATSSGVNRDTMFYGPRGIAIGPDGDVYVTDTGNKRVLIFDADGGFRRKIDSGMAPGKVAPDYPFSLPGELNEPIGVAVDAQGNVYVADTNNRRIQKFDATGKVVAQWPVASGWEPGEYLEPFITVDSAGNLYATAPTGKKVLKYGPDGTLLGEKSGAGISEPMGTLNLPTGIAVDAEGNSYVVDTRGNGVLKFDW